MRIVISIVCCLVAAAGESPRVPTYPELLAMPAMARTAALLDLREADDLAALDALRFTASGVAEARRTRGEAPLSPGCQQPDEFDVESQLRLARLAPNGASFAEAMRRYMALTTRLDGKLATARATDEWRRQFPALKTWHREWQEAHDSRVRELLRRTLGGQAIRSALARARNPIANMPAAAPGSKRAIVRIGNELALAAYREYVFNLMCIDDESNLNWFKVQIAQIGWFGKREYGWAADRAAVLFAQHADADPDFQAQIARALEPRLETGDTDPENFAYLVDRVAVRAGRPQRFGTQVECVDGRWIAPEIEARETLDERRDRVNLVAYDIQVARMAGMCND